MKSPMRRIDNDFYRMKQWPGSYGWSRKLFVRLAVYARGIFWRLPWMLLAYPAIIWLCFCTLMINFKWSAVVDCWNEAR